MLLNISLLDIWGSGSVIPVEGCFLLEYCFCLYTPNADLGSAPLIPSLFPGLSVLAMGLGELVPPSHQWLQPNLQSNTILIGGNGSIYEKVVIF